MPDHALTWSILVVVWGVGLVIVNKGRRTRRVVVVATVILLGAAQVANSAAASDVPSRRRPSGHTSEHAYPAANEYIRGCYCPEVEGMSVDPDDLP